MDILAEYQQQVMRGMRVRIGVDVESHAALGLVAEAGEVADIIKKSQYATPRSINPLDLVDECGDVLWYLTFILGWYGLSIEDCARRNIAKLAGRYPSRYTALPARG